MTGRRLGARVGVAVVVVIALQAAAVGAFVVTGPARGDGPLERRKVEAVAPPAPAVVAVPAVCHVAEDRPGWDCTRDGNGLCSPTLEVLRSELRALGAVLVAAIGNAADAEASILAAIVAQVSAVERSR